MTEIEIRPFRIAVSEELLEDLRERLQRTRWPEPLDDPDWDYGTEQGYLSTPTGLACFPGEVARAPRAWLEARANLVHHEIMPRGGHFAALEQPELLVEDVRRFFRTRRG